MTDYKKKIAEAIEKVTNIDSKILESFIEIPPDANLGDYAFPCFKLAKELKKAPPIIAQEIKDNIVVDSEIIDKIDIVGGYLNIYINKKNLANTVLREIEEKNENYGSQTIGNGQTIVIDYSSPNIAKPFHIGHLRSTVIGGALYNIYNFLGYNTVGINHIGDYGTQFGKLIEGYKRWGNEYDIKNNPIDELTKIYVRINELCKEDESVLEECRNNFKKLEDGDEYCTKLWNEFRSLSLEEFKKVYDMLGSKFDSYNGEAFYSDKMGEVIEKLDSTGKLVESEGAKVIKLDEQNIAPCLIIKSNGSTTYATRDLAAILYRARTYDYSKAIYVTSYEQSLHFKQVFEVAKLLGLDKKYTDNLIHVPFGMIHLTTGKMSTREGNVVKLEDLLNEAVSRAKEIIEKKNPDLENKDDVAKKVGVGAIIFNDLSNNRIKDEIFDWNQVLNFNGETGPYIQYMYVRTKSILEKAMLPQIDEIDTDKLSDNESIQLLKKLYEFVQTLRDTADKNEPSILARYLIDLSSCFSTFYNEHRIIGEEKNVQDARLYLTYACNLVLKTGARITWDKHARKNVIKCCNIHIKHI